MLSIYNTLTGQKELFKPLLDNKVGLYVCGMTVYDDCHIGHARVLVCFDVIARYIRTLGYNVTYVRNITDIDDKIIKRAKELNLDYKILTERVISSMHDDEKTLGNIPPDFEPRVTQHIPDVIALIATLIEKDFAYIASNGDVYYAIDKFPHYGELANKDLASLKAGARVEPSIVKRNALDFVLWKLAKPNEPSWKSPWGEGRPGWHIECSAMAKHYLGSHFDIHGGGADLQFPHHQNELAQSEAANCCKFVNFWMHVGFVQINKEKMAKSLGNFCTIKEATSQHHPEILRYLIVSSHYRSPLNYSTENLSQAQAALQRLYLVLRAIPPAITTNKKIATELTVFKTKFLTAMNDDFNTPEALAVLFNLAHEINRLRDNSQLELAQAHSAMLIDLGSILGILQHNPDEFLRYGGDTNKIDTLIMNRNTARQNRNWAEADKIRTELTDMGVILEDTAQGTTWIYCGDEL